MRRYAWLLLLWTCVHTTPIRQEHGPVAHVDIPACNTPKQIVRYSIDPKFTISERAKINHAFQVWTEGTNGHAVFLPGNEVYILRTTDSKTIARLTGLLDIPVPENQRAAGVYTMANIRKEVHIIVDAIAPKYFESVTIHELGHVLGLSHNSGKTYMKAAITDVVPDLLDKPALPKADRDAYFHLRGCQ